MDHKLIAAAARLCGWELRGARYERQDGLEMAWVGLPVEDASITGAGLLALEDALAEAGWVWDKEGDEGGTLCFRWRNRTTGALVSSTTKRHQFLHPDRSVAACLAAQQELGDE